MDDRQKEILEQELERAPETFEIEEYLGEDIIKGGSIESLLLVSSPISSLDSFACSKFTWNF